MLVYDIRAVMIDESLKAHLITFNSAQQIKETERSIRLKEMKKVPLPQPLSPLSLEAALQSHRL